MEQSRFYHLFPAPFWPQLFDAILLAKTFQGHQQRRFMLAYPCNADPLHAPLYSELWVHKVYTFFIFFAHKHRLARYRTLEKPQWLNEAVLMCTTIIVLAKSKENISYYHEK